MRFCKKAHLFNVAILAISCIAAVTFYLSFQKNHLNAADDSWFKNHQFDSEALIIGKMVFTRHEGLWNEGGRIGRYHEIQGNTDINQTKLFEETLSQQGKYYPYSSQIGGQGLFYSVLHQQFIRQEIPLNKQIEKLHQISSFLLAVVLAVLILFIGIEFGIVSAALTTLSLAYAQWLVVFADNLYWFTWSMYAPMVCMFGYLLFRSKNGKKPKARYIALSLFCLVAIRCSAGYEYISTILIAMITPVAYYAYKDKWGRYFTLRFIFIIGTTSVAAFISINVLHVYQISIAEAKPFLESLSERLSHAHSRTHIDADAFSGGAWREGTTASLWDILHRYWTGEGYKFSNFSNLKVHINFYDIVYLLIGLTLASQIPLSERSQHQARISPTRNVKYQALRYASWLALLAPISWYVLAKVHSYVHGHMNHLLWHIPTTIWVAIFAGALLQERITIISATLRENLKARYITLTVITCGSLYYLLGANLSYNKVLTAVEKETVYSFDISEENKVLLLNDGTLVIYYQDCGELNKDKRFFLHVYTANKKNYENLDFNWHEKSIPSPLRQSCLAVVDLPPEKIDKIRIGQFDGPRLWDKLYHLTKLDKVSFTAKDLTDQNWKNGISIRGDASLFTSNTLELRQALTSGSYLTLPHSGTRRISRAEHTSRYINIWLDGAALSPELDGYPNKINHHLEEKSHD